MNGVDGATPKHPVGIDQRTAPLSLAPFGEAVRGCAQDAMRAARDVPSFGTNLAATIAWAVQTAVDVPPPGMGQTAETWELLASIAMLDVSAARILEPHLDALSILAEAQREGRDADLDSLGVTAASSWGVYAAEGARVNATHSPDGWRLTGTKNWCSLAGQLSHALVTAWTGPDTRRLFAVALRDPRVVAHDGPWVSRGLPHVVSASVDFSNAPAVPIGEDGWYLTRPGFAWGGMGVAAVWWGAAVPLVHAIAERASTDRADQLALMYAGAADSALWATRSVLAEGAAAIDAPIVGRDLKITAERVRSITATRVEEILSLADRALGPGPLTSNEAHARRVADLRIYLRQHHGERDLARLGTLVTSS